MALCGTAGSQHFSLCLHSVRSTKGATGEESPDYNRTLLYLLRDLQFEQH